MGFRDADLFQPPQKAPQGPCAHRALIDGRIRRAADTRQNRLQPLNRLVSAAGVRQPPVQLLMVPLQIAARPL